MNKLTRERRAASSSSSSSLNRKLLLSAGSCVILVLSVLTNEALLLYKNSIIPSNSSTEDATVINKNGKVVSLPNGELLNLDDIRFTFPTIEERVTYYMGSWYNRTANSWEKASLCSTLPFFTNNNNNPAIRPFYNNNPALQQWASQPWHNTPYIYDEHTVTFSPFKDYSRDALKYYFANAEKGSRFIMSFGDECHPEYEFMPGLIVKSRWASPNHFKGEPATGPIMGYFETERHYTEPFEAIKKLKESIPSWENKKDAAIWRGASTGEGRRFKALSVIKELNRTDIDVGFYLIVQQEPERPGRIPREELHKFPVQKPISMAEMLQYKYLLSIEGNDVATNLKWLLYSNSVVFQPLPTRVAWCMEDKLIPFYHYIPVKSDFSDLGIMIDWARKNDDLVQEIIRHSTEYIENLIVSEEAKAANDEIIRRMVRLYSAEFGDVLSKCKGPTATL